MDCRDDAWRRAGDPVAIGQAPAADLFRLLTALIRHKRFREGALLEAAEAGIIDAITRRAAALSR